MNIRTIVAFVTAISAILAEAPGSAAHPQYLTSFDSVYGNGSCGTCHIRAPGGGPLNSYGTLFQDQPNHVADASAALRSIGLPPGSAAIPATTTLTATPSPAGAPISTEIPAETPAGTTATTSKIQAAPGFVFVFSLIGLFFSWALLSRKHNKWLGKK